MAVQNNNMLLLEFSGGYPRTISLTDEITLTPASFDLSAPGDTNIATGGSVADVQAPTVRVGSESTGSYANDSVTIGASTSTLYFFVEDNVSDVLTISQGANTYFALSTANGSESVVLGNDLGVVTINTGTAALNLGTSAFARSINLGTGAAVQTIALGSSTVGSSVTIPGATTVGTTVENGTGAQIDAGSLVVVQASGTPAIGGPVLYVGLASRGASPDTLRGFAGVAVENIASGTTGKAATVAGTVVPVVFETGDEPGVGDRGKAVYLSATPGQAAMTPPDVATNPDTRVFIVGYVANGTAVSGKYYIQLMPQFVADIP